LANIFPEVAEEWNYKKNYPLEPSNFKPKSGIKVWWICSKGHKWKAKIDNRIIGGRGCPYCAGKKVTDDNNFGVQHPDLVDEWHPTKNGNLTPFMVTSGSGKKVWWICSKGHEWDAAVYNRANGTGCPYCSGQRVGKYNNLAIKNPELAKQWHPKKNGKLTPYDVTPGSGKKVWWKCEQGHTWKAIVNSRNKGRGCPDCSKK
jgi:hypothetical protein